jgi:hypothetical protein
MYESSVVSPPCEILFPFSLTIVSAQFAWSNCCYLFFAQNLHMKYVMVAMASSPPRTPSAIPLTYEYDFEDVLRVADGIAIFATKTLL